MFTHALPQKLCSQRILSLRTIESARCAGPLLVARTQLSPPLCSIGHGLATLQHSSTPARPHFRSFQETILTSAPRRSIACSAAAAAPVSAALAHASGLWRIWAVLSCCAALGFISERHRIGRELSGPLVATLLGLLASNLGLIPSVSAQYEVVNKFLLPLAVPLLLFTADIRRVFRETGKLLVVFVMGSVATIVGTLAAAKLFPLVALGQDAWKVAAALCARHIGGAVNYVAVADATGMSASVQSAGLAADNLVCAVYFTTLFYLARTIPPDTAAAPESGAAPASTSKEGMKVLEGAVAVAVSAVICWLAMEVQVHYQLAGFLIPIATAITVVLATAAPKLLAPLEHSAEAIAGLLMMFFFSAIGANSSVSAVITTAPSIFFFCLLQIALHLTILLGLGRLFGFSRRDVLIASNANVGGPTTAAGMAAAKGWKSSITPALLVGTFGYATATFISLAGGRMVLMKMMT